MRAVARVDMADAHKLLDQCAQQRRDRDAERYLDIVARHAREVSAPTGPGDFVLYRWGRAFAHGAIVVAWPSIIHALIHVGVTEDNGEAGQLAGRARRFFTLW